ncbi:MAG: type IV pilus secretin PilQ family protein [Pseudomonadales bacterium]|nr:type IV pilus secretin PilQ family protein [Pseudomonadales bacterium]
MVRRGLSSLLALVLLGLHLTAGAASLEDIRFTTLPNDIVEIELTFDGAAPEPTGYSIDQPARIALDLADTRSALSSKYHSLGNGNTRSVTVLEAQDRTRVIINLTELVGYETERRGDALLVRVGVGQEVAAVGAPATTSSSPIATPRSASSGASEVEDIDFRRGADGEGRIVVTLSDPKAPVDVRSEGGNVRVEVAGTSLPTALRRRLDVSDFATPVQIVDAVEESGRTVITIRAEGDYDYLAYQADEVLTVNVRPVRADDPTRGDDVFQYKGEKLSLNFQDIEVRSVLQLIADFTDLNLVASDTVSGRITLRLQNVPWDQALDIVLRTKGLDKRQMGNVLMVAPAAEIAAREKQELDNMRQIEELAPLRTEFLQIRYASASELVSLFQATGEGEAGLLSQRGSLIVDDRTNSIIISETADKLNEIRRVIQQLDIPVRQVLIEARIVTANTNFTEELGIRWGGGALAEKSDNFLKIGGSLNTIGEIQNGIGSNQFAINGEDALSVNLPLNASTSSFAIGVTGQDYLLDLELTALASDGQAEVVARPKVITADKQQAVVASGVEIPFQQAASSGATAVQFKEAVLALNVTPQITPDDRIIMDLQVNQDTVGQVFNGVPSINTNEITTQVLVDNGQTLVLGGIFQTSSQLTIDKTPFLGDIPYVGKLFRRRTESDDKQELLIFITPRIIQDALSRR